MPRIMFQTKSIAVIPVFCLAAICVSLGVRPLGESGGCNQRGIMCVTAITGGNGYLIRKGDAKVVTIPPFSQPGKPVGKASWQIEEDDAFWLDRSAEAQVSMYYLPRAGEKRYNYRLRGVDYHEQIRWSKPDDSVPLTPELRAAQARQLRIRAIDKAAGDPVDDALEFPAPNHLLRNRVVIFTRKLDGQTISAIAIWQNGKRVGYLDLSSTPDSSNVNPIVFEPPKLKLQPTDDDSRIPLDIVLIFDGRKPQKRHIYLSLQPEKDPLAESFIKQCLTASDWNDLCEKAQAGIDQAGSESQFLLDLRDCITQTPGGGRLLEKIKKSDIASQVLSDIGKDALLAPDEIWDLLR